MSPCYIRLTGLSLRSLFFILAPLPLFFKSSRPAPRLDLGITLSFAAGLQSVAGVDFQPANLVQHCWLPTWYSHRWPCWPSLPLHQLACRPPLFISTGFTLSTSPSDAACVGCGVLLLLLVAGLQPSLGSAAASVFFSAVLVSIQRRWPPLLLPDCLCHSMNGYAAAGSLLQTSASFSFIHDGFVGSGLLLHCLVHGLLVWLWDATTVGLVVSGWVAVVLANGAVLAQCLLAATTSS